MARVIYLALAIAVLVLLVPRPASGAATLPPPWEVRAPANVPLGQPIPVTVGGPANETFTLNFTAAPFNFSYPAFVLGFKMPYHGSPFTVLNLSIPSTVLGVGAYQIALWNSTRAVAWSVFHALDPVNGTQIEQNLSQIASNMTQLQGEVPGIASQYEGLRLLLSISIGVFVAATVLVMLWGFALRAKERGGTFGRKTGFTWRRLWYGPAFTRDSESFEPPLIVTPDPDRIYKSGFCDLCKTAYFTEEQIIAHLSHDETKAVPCTGTRIPHPLADRDYYADTAVLEALEPMDTLPRSTDKTLRDKRDDILRITL